MKTYILTEEELDVLLGNAYHQGFARGKGEPASLSEKACLVMCHGLYDSLYAPEWQMDEIPNPIGPSILFVQSAGTSKILMYQASFDSSKWCWIYLCEFMHAPPTGPPIDVFGRWCILHKPLLSFIRNQ